MSGNGHCSCEVPRIIELNQAIRFSRMEYLILQTIRELTNGLIPQPFQRKRILSMCRPSWHRKAPSDITSTFSVSKGYFCACKSLCGRGEPVWGGGHMREKTWSCDITNGPQEKRQLHRLSSLLSVYYHLCVLWTCNIIHAKHTIILCCCCCFKKKEQIEGTAKTTKKKQCCSDLRPVIALSSFDHADQVSWLAP